MHARIDISEVELRTKIRAKYLRAIENEEWDLLPGPVYVKSFLKTYGDYLGLDSRLLVDEFKRRYERLDHEPRAMTGLSRERERPREHRGGGRGGNRGGGRGGRSGSSRGGSRGGARTPASRQSPGRGSALAALVFSPKGLIAVVLVAIVAALYLIGSHGGGKTSGGNGGSTTPPVTTPRGHPPKTHTTTTPAKTKTVTKPPAPTNATLALVPSGSVWVCVENASKKPLIDGRILQVGDKIPTVTAKGLLVTLGNANIKVTVNGKPYPLTASTNPIAFQVTPSSVKTLGSGPTCGA